MTEPPVRMSLSVRYHECDQQGVVFNANYLAYLDMASLEFCKEAFGSYDKLVSAGFDMVVAESTLQYLAPSRFEDDLVVNTTVNHVGTTSFTLGFTITRDDETIVIASNRYVWVSTDTQRPVAPTEAIRERTLDFRSAE